MAIDWRKLRTEYVTGQLSYRALAKKYGVAHSTVCLAAKKAGWTEARRQYGEKVAQRTAETLCARTSEREAERLLRLQEAALYTAELLADVLRDPDQFKRHLVVRSTTGVGSQTEERVFEKLDMRAIRAYTASIQSMASTMRNLFDLPTMLEKQAMNVQRERLKLEQEKRTEADGNTGETGVAQIAALLSEAGSDGAVADGMDEEAAGGSGGGERFAHQDGFGEDDGTDDEEGDFA